MAIGLAPLLAVNAGVLPPGADQLGALSTRLAGIILAVVEGRKGGVQELLGRFLWRVGIGWWAFVLFFPVITATAIVCFAGMGNCPYQPSSSEQCANALQQEIEASLY